MKMRKLPQSPTTTPLDSTAATFQATMVSFQIEGILLSLFETNDLKNLRW